jgi:cobalt-zinc-cadmium efflux system outer membrane protein
MPVGMTRWSLLAVCATVPIACVSVPPQPRPDPSATAQAFQSRRLDRVLPDAPRASAGWNRAQWLDAALRLNPTLAEARARATAVAAAERTAAQRPNPSLNLFGEYVAAAAGGVGWLYGLSLDFLLQRPGERTRARESAALETQAAQSDVAESIWQVRSDLRQALLDAMYAQDQGELLEKLLEDRQELLNSAQARAQAGEIGPLEIARASVELAAAQQRLDQARTHGLDAQARLAAAIGVPAAALDEVPLQWPGWADIAALTPAVSADERAEALIARPDLVRTLREYDLADNALRGEVARRWPAFHIEPGYAWDKGGVRENQLNETLHDNELGVSLELPLFNRNEGPIGEALARRTLAGKHLEAVQAELFGQIERAERGWPRARAAWLNATAVAATAQRQSEAEQRALEAGASDRPSSLSAAAATVEAQLLRLEAAYEAQDALGALESAYRRPLEGPERELPQKWRTE